MAFEQFVAEHYQSDSMGISIRKGGQIAFRKGIVGKFDLIKKGFVILFYDKTEKKIGFTFSKKFIRGCFPIKKYKTSPEYTISAKSIFVYYAIKCDKTMSYETVVEDIDGQDMLVIKLTT